MTGPRSLDVYAAQRAPGYDSSDEAIAARQTWKDAYAAMTPEQRMQLAAVSFPKLGDVDFRFDAATSARESVRALQDHLTAYLPDGREKTLALEKLQEVGLWAYTALAGEPEVAL